MSSYRLKFRSHPKPVTEQTFTVSRSQAVAHLKTLNAVPELDRGQKILHEMLSEALSKPNWKTIKVTIKS